MKNISLVFASILLIFSINACQKSNPIGEGVSIRVDNQTAYTFDSFEFKINSESSQEIIEFEHVESEKITNYKIIDHLDYHQYDSNEYVYFGSKFAAYIGGEKYEFIYGICGVGLISKSTDNRKFNVLISGIDVNKHEIYCSQFIEN